MRVAIDARELTGHTTGVGRYLSELLVEWQATGVDRRHELRLYAHAPPAAIAPASDAGPPVASGRFRQVSDPLDHVVEVG